MTLPRPRPTAALLLLSLLAACDAKGRRSDLLLLTTGTVNGYVEPCGCVAGQIGGIDRLAGYVEDELAKHPASLFVDTGDVVGEELDVSPSVLEQLPYKAEAFVRSWAEVGCVAMAVGEMDLGLLGVDEMMALSERHGLPFINGNIVDADGNDPFPDYVVVERGGKRIGIFSLLAPKLMEAKTKEPEKIEVSRLIAKQGLELLDWRERAQAIVDELLPQTDMILCASHLGFDLNRRLARRFPQVDLVFGGHFGQAESARTFVQRTPVTVALVRGARVDRMEWWWPDEDEYFLEGEERRTAGHGELADVSVYEDVKLEILVQHHEHEDMVERELAYPAGSYRQLLGDKVVLLNRALRRQTKLDPMPTGNRFSHVQVPMHRNVRRSDKALAAVDDYHDSVYEHWTERAPADPERHSAVFLGYEACESCHPTQVEFWKATRHSFALTALETTRQEVDAECFPCHTVGWDQPGGFRRPGRHQGFENVGCAACHGPGAVHVRGGASYLVDGLIATPQSPDHCKTCHNSEHDPEFDKFLEPRWIGAVCPPMPEPAERTPEAREAARIGALVLSEAERPPYELISDAYWKADLPEESLAVARTWVGTRPKNVEARVLLGERLLAVGEMDEAASHFELVTRRDLNNAKAWAGLARALAKSDPERAMEAAREAASLEPGDPYHVRIVVEILVDQNRMGAATELVGTYVAANPALRQFFADLVELPDPTALRRPGSGPTPPVSD
jgi:hypothetical protein